MPLFVLVPSGQLRSKQQRLPIFHHVRQDGLGEPVVLGFLYTSENIFAFSLPVSFHSTYWAATSPFALLSKYQKRSRWQTFRWVPSQRRLFAAQIDNKHVVFGRVIDDGMLVVRKIENVATGKNNKPNLPCVITECGEY
jgi:hypothetical protein